jgi:hypothetical protein
MDLSIKSTLKAKRDTLIILLFRLDKLGRYDTAAAPILRCAKEYKMPQTTYFVKECPTCGRKLQVRVEYLGREMVCNHCGGDFLAGDAQDVFTPSDEECSDAILLRVDELIDKANNNIGKPK